MTQQTRKQTTSAPSGKLARQRAFLMVLPILVLPFLTFLVWSIGLVGTGTAKGQAKLLPHGLDMSLPNAKIKDNKGWTKLNYYNEADKDSAEFKAAMQNDPYYSSRLAANNERGDSFLVNTGGSYSTGHFTYDPTPGALQDDPDRSVEKVNQKLAELNKSLNNASTPDIKPAAPEMPVVSSNTGISSPDIDRLENMLQAMNQNNGGQDPEVQQLNGVMDKILDIQHPELVKEKIRRESEKNSGQVYPVTVGGGKNNITLLAANQVRGTDRDTTTQIRGAALHTEDHNRFYSLEDNPHAIETQNTIEAVVDQTQTLESGSAVKLRLTDDIYIGGILVPKGNFVYGVAQLNGERLMVSIHSIRYLDNILPVALSAFDLDGMEGIDVPGAITRDVAKQSGDEAIRGLGLTAFDQSIGAQAASAGIQAAKNLIGKKIKLVKVTVKAGYQVLLKNSNYKQG